jgi:hypothetical protein
MPRSALPQRPDGVRYPNANVRSCVMQAPPAIPRSTARQRSSLVGMTASRAMIRSASVWRFGVGGSNGRAISWSSSIRPVCPKMVDQTLQLGKR